MSAASIYVAGDTACIVSDRAQYDDDGRILTIGSKVAASERLRLAMTTTGCVTSSIDSDLTAWMDQQVNARQALARLPDYVAQLQRELEEGCRDPALSNGHRDPVLQLFIAAFLPGLGPACFILAGAAGTFGPDYVPGTLRRVGAVVSPPVPEDLHPSAPSYDPGRMLDVQRSSTDDRGIARVGGGGDLTTVDAAGVRTVRLRDWPQDRVGQSIKQQMLPQRSWWRRGPFSLA